MKTEQIIKELKNHKTVINQIDIQIKEVEHFKEQGAYRGIEEIYKHDIKELLNVKENRIQDILSLADLVEE